MLSLPIAKVIAQLRLQYSHFQALRFQEVFVYYNNFVSELGFTKTSNRVRDRVPNGYTNPCKRFFYLLSFESFHEEAFI